MKLNQIRGGRSILDLPRLARYANQHYHGDFNCIDEKLTSLEGAPSSVSGAFFCQKNRLVSLEGGPASVGGPFFCDDNRLASLRGAPSTVGDSFYCHNNRLVSLAGAPTTIDGAFYCVNNRLTSLKDIHRHIKSVKGSVDFSKNPIRSHVLGVLLIKGVTLILLDNKAVQEILNRHLPSSGIDSVLEAQAEMLDAGLDEYAEI